MPSRSKIIGTPSGVIGSVPAYQVRLSDGHVVNSYSLSCTTDVDYYQHAGVDTPNFMARRARGELIPYTSWFQIQRFGKPVHGKFDYSLNGYRHYHDGVRIAPSWGWYIPVESPSVWEYFESKFPDLVSEVDFEDYVQAAAASIYSRGWDALTFAAELRKTILSFRKVGFKLLALIRQMRRELSWPELWRLLSTASDWWLQWRYEWRVLYYDMQDISRAVKSLSEQQHDLLTERVGETFEDSTSWVTNRDNTDFRFPVNYELKAQLSARGSVAARISPPDFAFNPLTTAWEVTLFSFIVDWFIDVGQMLEALSFRVLSESHTAAHGWQLEMELTTSCTNITPKTGGTWLNPQGYQAKSSVVVTSRTPHNVSYIPQLKLNLSTAKILDLLALIRKAMS